MALARPRSLTDMEELPGMGATKLDRYGAAFLKAIASA
jgi:superfamily II DNA helicase RecQ